MSGRQSQSGTGQNCSRKRVDGEQRGQLGALALLYVLAEILPSCSWTENGGSKLQSQCLVVPGVLKEPEPPEQSTCTGSLVQVFNLVDPGFALCMSVRWHWRRSSQISVPAGGGVMPGVPWLLGPCLCFSSCSSLAAHIASTTGMGSAPQA